MFRFVILVPLAFSQPACAATVSALAKSPHDPLHEALFAEVVLSLVPQKFADAPIRAAGLFLTPIEMWYFTGLLLYAGILAYGLPRVPRDRSKR